MFTPLTAKVAMDIAAASWRKRIEHELAENLFDPQAHYDAKQAETDARMVAHWRHPSFAVDESELASLPKPMPQRALDHS